jgi:hypothetical protein
MPKGDLCVILATDFEFFRHRGHLYKSGQYNQVSKTYTFQHRITAIDGRKFKFKFIFFA